MNRQTEIEAKRARLEELRRRREEAERNRASSSPVSRGAPLSSVVALVASSPAVVRYTKTTQTEPLEPPENVEKQLQESQTAALEPSIPTLASEPPPVAPEPPKAVTPKEPEVKFTVNTEQDTQFSQQFVENAFRVLERLTATNVMVDYTKHPNVTVAPENINLKLALDGPMNVIDIDWSPLHPNLIAVAYGHSNSIISPGGSCVYIWSLDFPNAPEYVLKSTTDIIHVRFSKTSPWLVYGAGYNGQIIAWDLRVGRNILATMRSSTDGSGHTMPVCCLEAIPSINHDTLFSLSVDGVTCAWPNDRIAKPDSKLALTFPGKTTAIPATCLSLWHDDLSQFLVGTLSGEIYSGRRVNSVGAKAGLREEPVFTGHCAPVTQIQYHPNLNPPVFLSTSLDWSIRIWSPASTSAPLRCLEIQRPDAVTDAAWSHHYSAVFASACRNELEIWNLSRRTDEPVATFETKELISRVIWDRYNKSQVVVGLMKGAVQLLDIDTSILEGNCDFESIY